LGGALDTAPVLRVFSKGCRERFGQL